MSVPYHNPPYQQVLYSNRSVIRLRGLLSPAGTDALTRIVDGIIRLWKPIGTASSRGTGKSVGASLNGLFLVINDSLTTAELAEILNIQHPIATGAAVDLCRQRHTDPVVSDPSRCICSRLARLLDPKRGVRSVRRAPTTLNFDMGDDVPLCTSRTVITLIRRGGSFPSFYLYHIKVAHGDHHHPEIRPPTFVPAKP